MANHSFRFGPRLSRPSTARLWEEARRVAHREVRDGPPRQEAESAREGPKAAEHRNSATAGVHFSLVTFSWASKRK